MNKKVGSYVISGFVLLYIGLSDDDFILFYNGIAVLAGFTAFTFAYIEWKKDRDKDKT